MNFAKEMMTMDSVLLDFAHWIAATSASEAFRTTLWIVPTSQSFHILAIAIMLIFGLIISFRLLGLERSQRATSELVATGMPWFWGAFGVLLATGLVQTIAEPARELMAWPFRLKISLIVVLVALLAGMSKTIRANPQSWDITGARTVAQRLTGLALLTLLVVIIFCGRFIAYVRVA